VCRQTLGLPAGFSHLQTMPFNLDAVRGEEGPAGSFTITATSGSVPDPHPGNNSASIDVRAVATAPSPEPTGGPAPSSSAPPTGDDGGLPVTGADVPVTAGLGLALLAVGTGAVLLLRRRARKFEA
jgi:LPXTG-motif cell wall-anchored protein